jgi:hypothetical protein
VSKEKTMSVEEFEETLRRFLQREPFEPFMVTLINGSGIKVLNRNVAFGGGAATYITPDGDSVEFVCEEVRKMRHLI